MGDLIVPLALLLVALVGMLCPSWYLTRAAWTKAAPGLALTLWASSAVSVLLSLSLLSLSLLAPVESISLDLPHLAHACPEAVSGTWQPAHWFTARAAFAVVTAVTVCAIGVVGTGLAHRTRSARQQQRSFLRLQPRISALVASNRVTLVEYPEPAAYCVPGREAAIVMTSGAANLLAPAQVAAVVAHERAHLRGRHHLAVFWSAVLARVFPRVPLFVAGRSHVARLVEMRADDIALRSCQRQALVKALITLASHRPAAPGTLGAGGDTMARVDRLLAPRQTPSFRARAIAAASVALLVTLPLLVGLVPSVLASTGGCAAH